MEIRALLVDDEQHAIDLFKKIVDIFPNQLKIVGEANNIPDALRKIEELKPDVVFLDVEMPNYSGLSIRDFVGKNTLFEIVYVTAHSDYAIEAIRLSAFDYLLKPVDEEALERVVSRLIPLVSEKNVEKGAGIHNEDNKKVLVNTHQGTYYIDVVNILFIQASAMYSIIHTEKDQVVVSKPLKDFSYLNKMEFFRTHRSYLVNTKKIIKFSSKEGTEVEITGGYKVPVSHARKDEFKVFMKNRFELS